MSDIHTDNLSKKLLADQFKQRIERNQRKLKEAIRSTHPEYAEEYDYATSRRLKQDLVPIVAAPKVSAALEETFGWLLDLTVPPCDRDMIRHYADHLTDYPYGESYSRKPFRTRSALAYEAKLHSILWPYIGEQQILFNAPTEMLLNRELPPKVLAFLDEYGSHYGCGYTGWQIAYALDGKNKAVEDAVTRILTEENSSNSLTRNLIYGICLSHRAEFHELLGKLLLAAKLQEGLRQTICECADCGTIEAFRTIVQVIADNDLIRYSSVKRAVGVWLGLITEETRDLDRISGKSLRLVVDCLESETLRRECLSSQDAMAIHIALWSYAVYDVNRAIEEITRISREGSKQQLLVAGYFAQHLDLPPVSHQIAKIVLKDRGQWDDILAIWLPCYLPHRLYAMHTAIRENRRIDYRLWFQSREEIVEQYALMKERSSRFPGKAITVSPCVFPWHEAKVCRDDFAQILCTLAILSEDRELIDEACAIVKDCGPNSRSFYFFALLRDPQSPIQRKTLIDGLADKESETRSRAYEIVTKLTLTPEEYRTVEDFLRYKNPDIRKNTLALLMKQGDQPLRDSLTRLLGSKKEESRLGALDMLLQLKEDPKRAYLADSFGELLKDRSKDDTLPPKEKILLDRLLPHAEETPLPDGEVYCPKDFDTDDLRLCTETFATYFPESKLPSMVLPHGTEPTWEAPLQGENAPCCATAAVAAQDLLSLHKWIEDHRTLPIKEFYGNTVLLGNVHSHCLKTNEGIQLQDLWEEWVHTNGITHKRILGASIFFHGFSQKSPETEAYSPLLEDVFGKGFVYCKTLPHHFVMDEILTWLRKSLPQEDRTQLARALALWLVRCVPTDRWILPRPDHYHFLCPLSQQRQFHLILEGLQCRYDETLHHTFPLAVACDQRIAEARKSFPETPKNDHSYHVNGELSTSGLDHRIREGAYAPPQAYLYAACQGILSRAQLYTHLLAPINLGSSLKVISAVASAYYDRGKTISTHNAYKALRAERTVKEFLKKEGDLTREDEALITFVAGVYEDLLPVVLSTELQRGDSPTVYTHGIYTIHRIYGASTLVQILHAMGKDPLDRTILSSWHSPDNRRSVLSYLLSVCIPRRDDTARSLKAALVGKGISKKRLIEAALFSPEWIPIIGQYLQLPSFTSVCYYFMAHMKENFDDKRKAMIAQYTPLTPEELNLGAFDVQWFRSAYGDIGEADFDLVYEAAKYITDGAKHTRARKYADAVLGKMDPEACKQAIVQKRNKDLLMAYALIPLQNEEDLCDRYLYIQAFRKEAKTFGSQRSVNESKAADMALRNLATNAGYSDPMHLTLRMETKIIEDRRDLLEVRTVEDTSFQILIDETGKVSLAVSKDGRALKSIPSKLKKHETVLSLTAMVKTLTEQYRRTRKLLEEAMEDQTVFTFRDLSALSAHPVVAPMLKTLVFLCGEQTGFLCSEGLTDPSGNLHPMEPDARLTLAHPYDLYRLGSWRDYQGYLYTHRITQPFRQVFRELYLKTPDEEPLLHSLRYAGNQIQPAKTLATLKSRHWVADVEDGLQKIDYKENIVAHIYALADWFSPADIEAPTLEWVCFTHRKTGQELPIREVPPILFSEVMRDVDLAVSVAHVGGVDPEASHSTVEMRGAILTFLLPMFRLSNVRVEGHHAIIQGKLGEYSVHLGSGVVHQIGGAMIPVLPIHSQHRGRIFLPFIDEDPKTAEILSKVLLFAEDHKIKDPMILSEIRR